MLFDIDYERCVLGCMLLDRECAERAPLIEADDFSQETHKLILSAIKDQVEKRLPVDLITIPGKIKHIMTDATGYLAQMADDVPTTQTFPFYIEKIMFMADQRAAIIVSKMVEERILSGTYEDTPTMKADIMELYDRIREQRDRRLKTLRELVNESILEMADEMGKPEDRSLYLDFHEIDLMLQGLHKKEMLLLGARPGVGKTAFMLKILRNLAKKGNNVVVFSREMSDKQLARRMMSTESGIDSNIIRRPSKIRQDEWDAIVEGADKLQNLPMMIDDTTPTIEELRALCRTLKRQKKIDVLAVDYLNLLNTLKKTSIREQEVAHISRSLKLMSKEFDIPIIALTQLNRESIKQSGKDKRPNLGHLRESGALEQDADTVVFLYIEDEERDEDEDPKESKEICDMEVIIAKQRNGPTGTALLKHKKSTFDFFEPEYGRDIPAYRKKDSGLK